MSFHTEWLAQGQQYGWQMIKLPWWKRLPVIRHIIAARDVYRIERWYSDIGLPGVRTGYDEWIVQGIWHGFTPPTGGSTDE